MPKPGGSSDQIVQQLQAAIAALQGAMTALQDLVGSIDADALLASIAAVEARVVALEQATPPGSLPSEVRWRSARLKLIVSASGSNVTVTWQSVGTSMPANVTLALDTGLPEPCDEGAIRAWGGVPAGTHYIVARVNGIEEARDTFYVKG